MAEGACPARVGEGGALGAAVGLAVGLAVGAVGLRVVGLAVGAHVSPTPVGLRVARHELGRPPRLHDHASVKAPDSLLSWPFTTNHSLCGVEPAFVMFTVFVSGSSVHEPPFAEPGYAAGSASALQNALCLLSKALAVWPTVTETPGGTARKNLRVCPAALPQPVKLAWALPSVVVDRGLRIEARSTGPGGRVGAAVLGLAVGAEVG